MTTGKAAKVALLWRGDGQARAALGIDAEPTVYADDMADEVRD